MSEQETLEQCKIAFPGISEGHHLFSLDQLKTTATNPDALAKQDALVKSFGFPDSTNVLDSHAKAAGQCGEQLRQADWEKEMATEIKNILATIDDKITQANLKGQKEVQVLRIGAEQITLGTLDHPPIKSAPELNQRQQRILDALNHKPGIDAELKKDSENVYWIVARHKR